ncbi:hypothetical protein VTJ49DRAFT_7528 [Mycothermus thermophilus]|uniref:Kinesin motor domain-containing protein n=1 Tax=Humicola insolens TaxID=85995 RepID=A0ABR3VH32_HUMIN
MDGPSLAPLLGFGCRGDRGRLTTTTHQNALHPLRRRANSCGPSDQRYPSLFTPTTLPPPPNASGALLLSSYLLVNFLLPRMRQHNNMDSSENSTFRSGLRPPQIHASTTSSYLTEITNSEANARAQSSGIPQKRTHKGSVSHPDPKRKTLLERAAEPHKSVGLPRPAATGIKGSSIAALHAETTQRHAFSKTIGPGAKPPAVTRAPTSMGFSSSTMARPRGRTTARPHTSMANREPDSAPSSPPKKGLSKCFQELSLVDPASQEDSALGLEVPVQPNTPPAERSQSDAQTEGSPLDKIPPQEEAGPATPVKLAKSYGPVPKTPPRAKEFYGALDTIKKGIGTVTKELSPRKSCSAARRLFLTKDSNLTNFTGWDVDGRLSEFESQFKVMKEAFEGTMTDRKALEDAIDIAKSRANDLEQKKQQLEDQMDELKHQLDSQRDEINSLQQDKQRMFLDMEAERMRHKYQLEDKERELRNEVEKVQRELQNRIDQLTREHRETIEAIERRHRTELADEQAQKARELGELRTRLGAEQQDLNLELSKKSREVQEMRAQIEELQSDLDREQTLKKTLQNQMTEMSTNNMMLEDRVRSLQAKIEFLESDSKQQSDSFAAMEARLQEALRVAEEARQKLIKEETERRVLFNKYQELKGNIRVMCRVRPILDPSEGEGAKIAFPDHKTSSQIDVTGPEEKNSLGAVTRRVLPFEFDRVFDPSVSNEEVFGEISQLVQSALDGYNVCIFCYGQTGSGKTYTMSSSDGMIPRATHMIYDTITKLREKSWSYTMEGSFVEVYNEELHDLLTPPSSGKQPRLEIRHDEQRKQTTVVNCKTVALDSPDKVEQMLRQAQSNRSVAATKANERSSRSHSVFMLRIAGENSATHERCEGTLNLVDLAGSERLKHSQAEGDRMRETQNINKSLACLGDVIEALGRGSGHVPYRNSKLTHLLQYSLGGNSKTLMFVMVSPLEAHLKETITSLRFATKVHNTHIGTAKSTKKLRSTTPESNNR